VSLSGAIAQGDWRLFFLQRDRVRAAKAADVQRVAEAYLLPDNRTLGLFIPTSAPKRPPAPQLVDVAPMVRDYRGDAAVAAGRRSTRRRRTSRPGPSAAGCPKACATRCCRSRRAEAR
jgi:hypothetical protein